MKALHQEYRSCQDTSHKIITTRNNKCCGRCSLMLLLRIFNIQLYVVYYYMVFDDCFIILLFSLIVVLVIIFPRQVVYGHRKSRDDAV